MHWKYVIVLSLLGGLSACSGSGMARPVVAHGTLDLAQALPAPTLTPYEAFGERQPSSRATRHADAQASIAPYLRGQRAPSARAPLPVSRGAKTRAPARAEAATPSPAATGSANGPPMLAANTESVARDAERYAQRANPQLESYRGGDVIVITAGTLIIVLLVVLLVLLLT